MNSTIHAKTITRLLPVIASTLLIIGPAHIARAVVPPPDGGYPNFNTAEGQNALFSLTTGAANTAVGWFSLFSNTEGSFNTATGAGALLFNTANGNTAFGTAALLFNTTGFENTAVGTAALSNNTTANFNTAVGYGALANTTGSANTAMGDEALSSNTTGFGNIAVGSLAGHNLTTGDSNIDIGNPGEAGESNTIRIGQLQTATFIAGISGATASGGAAVFVNSSGQLGTLTSSARFKNEIKPMDKASEAILALKPVTFRYKKEIDPESIPQFGLVAEDVAKVKPDLVARDAKGEPYSVRYEQINAMLLNEFLKEHRKVEALKNDFQATVAKQQKQIEALTAQLKKQAAQIQRVSAQVEVSNPAPSLALKTP